ncbi:winged helix-turn-helix domain-containing protein [Dokdonella sp. MW10]|uniref:winged helix-turn-helix domain-containing protein n=1 Tax=Dokdonella sp. MW10 TaxID=2992926 RepID=UPI003F7F7013
MPSTVYAFGEFLLDPLTRELRRGEVVESLPVSTVDCLIHLVRHRDRSVGRDELASAVWGRTDVSEASITQAIMRLRRVIGDASCIRTTPRLGYRWTVEPTRELTSDAARESVEPAPAPAGTATTPVSPPRRPLRKGFAVAATMVVAIMAAGAWWFSGREPDRLSPSTPLDATTTPLAAMVLPADVVSSGDWAWLRFGAMDLIANQLRDSGLTTTPSETTVGLVNAKRIDADTLEVDPSVTNVATLRIKPAIAQVGTSWNVRLSAYGPSGMKRVVEAQDRDALVAARRAADTLLVGLGHTPAVRPGAPDGVEELAQRIAAAGLAGQLDVARAIAAQATPEQLARPEIALSLAYVDFYKGDYHASRARCEALLESIPPDRDPRMRAHVITQIGVVAFREQKYDEAGAAFDKALDLLKLVNDPKAKAAAWTGRGGVDVMQGRIDAATAAMGQARLLHESANDAFGVARADLNLGAIAMVRGQPLVAVPQFEQAAERFEVLAVPEARDSALRSLIEAYTMLVEHDKALAAAERLGREDAQAPNARERWWNVLSRAVALEGVGRLDEATALLRRIAEDSDAVEDAAVRSEAEATLAGIALARGDWADAARRAQAALTPALETANEQDYFGAWAMRVRAIQAAGDAPAAAAESARLDAWLTRSPNDRRALLKVLLDARQARLEGRADVALDGFADALARAERSAIPEDILAVATPYVAALVEAGRIEDASALAGRVAPWADRDLRSALIAARTHEAMRQSEAAGRSLQRARELAGERPIATATR